MSILYKLALRIVANRIAKSKTRLTPQYLFDRGWIPYLDIKMGKTYIIKGTVRKRVWVWFAGKEFYQIYYGCNKRYIALAESVELLEAYMVLVNGHK